MKRLLVLFAAVMLFFSALPARAEIPSARREAADDFFTRLFSRKKTVGGAVIVNQEGRRLYEFFYGRAAGKSSRVTEDTVFKVASVTKLITAIGVMQLKEQGKIDLDEPLAKADGAPIRNPRYPNLPITLRQAMSHTSSLLPSANYTAAPKWTEKYFDDYAPGTRYTYANLNGGVLGSMIEKASGQSLNSYMAEHVFSPLNINAAYAATLLPDSAPLAHSFNGDGTVNTSAAGYLRIDASYDDTCDPAAHFRSSVGNLYISVKGLELLGAALANGGHVNGVELLTPLSVREMQADQRLLSPDIVCDSPYGLNTYRYQLAGNTWYGHQGWWSGRLVDVFYEPMSATAVVLVMNGINRTVGDTDPAVAKQMEDTLQFITPWVEDAWKDMTIIDEAFE